MRTQEEIVARYQAKKDLDLFGVIGADLLIYLDAEHLRPIVKPEAKLDDWQPDPLTDDTLRARITDYLPFAWEKAQDERGLSANRSIQHFQSWLWLLGEEELLRIAEDDDQYAPYGKPILRRLAQHFGVTLNGQQGEEHEHKAEHS